MKLKIAHASLQFSDTAPNKETDVRKIFAQDYDLITGTEAGPGAYNTSDELRDFATSYGYKLSITDRYDTWVAVKRELIQSGSWKEGSKFALWRSSRVQPPPPGRWGDKAIVWAQFFSKEANCWIAMGSVHYLTHGGTTPKYKVWADKTYANTIGEWTERFGRARRVAFMNGDFNLRDDRYDVFYGHPLTTCWDELGKYPSTGHGTIDAIASFNRDVRVTCLRARAYPDGEFFLHTDHYLIDATYEINPARGN